MTTSVCVCTLKRDWSGHRQHTDFTWTLPLIRSSWLIHLQYLTQVNHLMSTITPPTFVQENLTRVLASDVTQREDRPPRTDWFRRIDEWKHRWDERSALIERIFCYIAPLLECLSLRYVSFAFVSPFACVRLCVCSESPSCLSGWL